MFVFSHPSCRLSHKAFRFAVPMLFAALFLLIFGPTPPLHAQAATHTVQPGETLSQIAEQYGTTESALLELNDLEEPDMILVGQALIVPAAAPFATAAPGQHRVQVGETLSQIAHQYGLTLEQLMTANGIIDADNVFSGQLLKIPGTDAVAPTLVSPLQETIPADDPELTSARELPETYTVAEGDTLTAIARRFAIDIDALRTLNAIGDADSIFVGQTLRLVRDVSASAGAPSELSATEQSATSGDSAAISTGEATPTETVVSPPSAPTVELPIERSGNPIGSLNQSYRIRPGDTLSLIALRTGVDADTLRRLNGYDNVNAPLSAGQSLLLPATGEELRPRTPAREHQVQRGESLSQIAADNGISLGALLQANRIANPNAVYPGQLLLIPSPVENSATGRRIQIRPPRNGYFYYTVQPGDTMSEIAKSPNTTMLAIQTYNNLPNTETVYNNMEFKIPYGPPPLDLTQPPIPLLGTRFVVSLSRQQCWVYQGEHILYSWSCSTGAGERRTKAGNYAVQSKILNAKSNVWRLDMPYWLGIYDVGPFENGIHGLPVAWKTGKKIWSGLIGQPATFGCAMLDDTEAATLFRLAFLGMPVHVIN